MPLEFVFPPAVWLSTWLLWSNGTLPVVQTAIHCQIKKLLNSCLFLCENSTGRITLFVNYFRVKFAFALEIDYLCVGESLGGLSLFS